MRFFLIRHPRPLIDDGICYGRLDVGCADPQPVAERLRKHLPAAVPLISSPLRRARRLAELLHAQPRFDDRLMEIDFGEWEGRRWPEIGRAAIDAWAADVLHFAPPGGESAATLQARAIDCVSGLSGRQFEPDESGSGLARDWRQSRASPLPPKQQHLVTSVALVTHGGVLRALLGHWLQLPAGEWCALPFDFGSITRVDVGNGKATLRYLNR
ncbi:MAG: alpha-ribazole phosphatase family protein [Betaproteobacteria bacterium]|nr:alpha-ribazole phosphatase family protein [Betaproteobacteria bacterium]